MRHLILTTVASHTWLLNVLRSEGFCFQVWYNIGNFMSNDLRMNTILRLAKKLQMWALKPHDYIIHTMYIHIIQNIDTNLMTLLIKNLSFYNPTIALHCSCSPPCDVLLCILRFRSCLVEWWKVFYSSLKGHKVWWPTCSKLLCNN